MKNKHQSQARDLENIGRLKDVWQVLGKNVVFTRVCILCMTFGCKIERPWGVFHESIYEIKGHSSFYYFFSGTSLDVNG